MPRAPFFKLSVGGPDELYERLKPAVDRQARIDERHRLLAHNMAKALVDASFSGSPASEVFRDPILLHIAGTTSVLRPGVKQRALMVDVLTNGREAAFDHAIVNVTPEELAVKAGSRYLWRPHGVIATPYASKLVASAEVQVLEPRYRAPDTWVTDSIVGMALAVPDVVVPDRMVNLGSLGTLFSTAFSDEYLVGQDVRRV